LVTRTTGVRDKPIDGVADMSSETIPHTGSRSLDTRQKRTVSTRASAVADRLEQGAQALATLASTLTDAQWQMRVSARDGRKIGVVVHHVASVYPVEIQLAQVLADGKPIVDVTMDDVNNMNADHAQSHDGVTKAETLDLLRRNSAVAAATIRALSDEELDRAAPASLYFDAPITCQFMLEDHAVRHSYHHLARIRAALKA
jgi:DinB superfamily